MAQIIGGMVGKVGAYEDSAEPSRHARVVERGGSLRGEHPRGRVPRPSTRASASHVACQRLRVSAKRRVRSTVRDVPVLVLLMRPSDTARSTSRGTVGEVDILPPYIVPLVTSRPGCERGIAGSRAGFRSSLATLPLTSFVRSPRHSNPPPLLVSLVLM